jgi:hypothetical protein
LRVSLFRRECVFASVELDRAVLLKLDAAGRPSEQAIIALSFGTTSPDEGLVPLTAALSAPAWRGLPRRVVLSDRLTHCLAVERPQGVRSKAELRLACEARFRATFGAATDWEIEVDMRPFARTDFVCGMPRALANALRTSFGFEGRLASLAPFAVCELRRLARRLPKDCWLIVLARDCLTVAGIAAGECRLVRGIAIEHPSIAAVQETLAREQLLSGEVAADAPVYVVGTLQGELGGAAVERLDAPSWGTEPSSWARDFRLALSERWS